MTWSDRLSVTRSDSVIEKHYRLDSAESANDIATRTQHYYSELSKSEWPVHTVIKTSSQGEIVLVELSASAQPTLAQEITALLEASSIEDEYVAKFGLIQFQDMVKTLQRIECTQTSVEGVFGNHRYRVGAFWQPSAVSRADDESIRLTKFITPLSLPPETGGPITDGLPGDVQIPDSLMMYLCWSPVGVMHNLCESFLSLFDEAVSAELYQSLQTTITEEFARHMEVLGRDRQLAGLLNYRGYADTYAPIVRELDRGNTEPTDLVQLANSEGVVAE
jgi:hypothetical protein